MVVLDERRARASAQSLGLTVVGTLGLLLRAKLQGLIDHVGPTMAAMIEAGLYASPALQLAILEDAGEA